MDKHLEIGTEHLAQELRRQARQLESNLSVLYAQKQAEKGYQNVKTRYERVLARLMLMTGLFSASIFILVFGLIYSLLFVDVVLSTFLSNYNNALLANFLSFQSTLSIEVQAILIVLALLPILGLYIRDKVLKKQHIKQAERVQLINMGEAALGQIRMLLDIYEKERYSNG